jgi:hypothetical protein
LILHVASGSPQLMVVTADSCSGPRAYAGLAFAYRELIQENFQRLTDDEWKQMAASPSGPPPPGWLSPVLQP